MPLLASTMKARLRLIVVSATRKDRFILGCLALFGELQCVDERRRLDRTFVGSSGKSHSHDANEFSFTPSSVPASKATKRLRINPFTPPLNSS